MLFSAVLTIILSASLVFAGANPWLRAARTPVNQAVCTDPATKFSEHDCDVALLGLGGGIAGAIEFLKVNAASTSAVSGTCRVTATATNGGNTIDISKGRLEGHGSPNGGYDNLKTKCGASPGHMVIGGGSNNGGDVEIAISAP